MMHTESPGTRTLTIVLPESDWRALRAEEPDAIAWLQAQIRQRLAPRPSELTPARAEFREWDDY